VQQERERGRGRVGVQPFVDKERGKLAYARLPVCFRSSIPYNLFEKEREKRSMKRSLFF
jgi:hypothetical protein